MKKLKGMSAHRLKDNPEEPGRSIRRGGKRVMAWNQLDLYSGILSEFAEHATECLRAWDAAQKIVGVGNSTVPFYRALQKAEKLRREALALLADA